jgi:tetratricopeptide (TPR) repeat protein
MKQSTMNSDQTAPTMNFLKLMARFLASFLLVVDPVSANGVGHAPWVGNDLNGAPCTGSDQKNYGPWDYRKHQGALPVVEKAHFTRRIELLVGGENDEGPATDIDYTLTKCPNHHRALNSMMQFHLINRGTSLARSGSFTAGWQLYSPAECYFQRALNYAPDDETTYMLFASFLHREGKTELAKQQYEKARELAPRSPNIEYNYALLLVDMQQYAEARQIAEDLYAHGFPLPGLKNKLVGVGEWEAESAGE